MKEYKIIKVNNQNYSMFGNMVFSVLMEGKEHILKN